MSLRVTLLGSGTSTGVPVIGCGCAVCTSRSPRNRRSRPGLKIEGAEGTVLVDASTDLREQLLAHPVARVDAVVFTHAHADHIFGLDDVRIFNFRQKAAIPCYGSTETLAAIRRINANDFEGGQEGGGKPQLDLIPIEGPFSLLGRPWIPIPVWHGTMAVLGFRVGEFAYVTDCNVIPESSFDLLQGVETLILDALRYRPHSTHFSLGEAVEAAERIGARRTYFTHLAHDIDQDSLQVVLPQGMEIGYDGLAFDIRG
jgi:phosphoribosyl 1,2-cyclic phosphate phosphodiesterase